MITLELYINDGSGFELYTTARYSEKPLPSIVKDKATKVYKRYRYTIGNRPWLVLQVPAVKKGRPAIPEETQNRMLELYHRTKSTREVAQIAGVSQRTVQKIIKAA